MRSPLRTAGIMVLIAFAAAAFMEAQADAMARALDARQLRLDRAAAVALAGTELARVGADLRAGRPIAPVHIVETDRGPMRVEAQAERHADSRHIVRLHVADDEGRMLTSYETVVDVEGR